jgi:hypothetical protein
MLIHSQDFVALKLGESMESMQFMLMGSRLGMREQRDTQEYFPRQFLLHVYCDSGFKQKKMNVDLNGDGREEEIQLIPPVTELGAFNLKVNNITMEVGSELSESIMCLFHQIGDKPTVEEIGYGIMLLSVDENIVTLESVPSAGFGIKFFSFARDKNLIPLPIDSYMILSLMFKIQTLNYQIL